MNSTELITQLQSLASEKYKANVVKMGIPEEHCIGVSTGEVISWDLCDHLCKNLIAKMKDYEAFIEQWITSDHIYKKRAAFTLIATSAIHDKKLSNDTLDQYLQLIKETQDIEHEHVKKAAAWALKEIGKRDFDYNEKALLTAHELLNSSNKTQQWIAKDAIKELETMVKVEGRTRLISTKTQMGRDG